jgi:CYTH domain-containing protein
MGTEIERKFLVTGDGWRAGARGEQYRQGYLSTSPGRTVRVRVAGERAYLTIKGARAGLRRAEFEYEIPPDDAEALLAELCEGPIIDKVRYRVAHGGLTWEVDEFAGENAGLIVAEVELLTEDQAIALPAWVGQEVSEDYRYTNAYLSQHPYRRWGLDSHDWTQAGGQEAR